MYAIRSYYALRVGDWTLLEANSGRLYTFLRQTENETILVVINFNSNSVSAEDYGIELPEEMRDETVTAVSSYNFV